MLVSHSALGISHSWVTLRSVCGTYSLDLAYRFGGHDMPVFKRDDKIIDWVHAIRGAAVAFQKAVAEVPFHRIRMRK